MNPLNDVASKLDSNADAIEMEAPKVVMKKKKKKKKKKQHNPN